MTSRPAPSAPARPAVLCYCQHSVGIGHLMRSYALCAALSERFRVVLLCGGALPEGIRPPAGVQVVGLPPLGVRPGGGFASRDARYTLEQAWALRSERILAAFRALRPSAVLVELFPFGRAKFARELVPLLEAARAAGALTACSLRDILVSRRDDQQEHDDRAAALANAHLDAVLVHSDPAFARLEETFAPRRPLRVPVHYTGFVVRGGDRAGGPVAMRGGDRAGRPVAMRGGDRAGGPVATRGGDRAGRPVATRGGAHEARRAGGPVVVSAGGGLVGEPLLRAAAEAQPATGLPMRLIGGPLLPDAAWRRLEAFAGAGVELRRTVQDLGAELAGARASVSQGGYNTALEVVRSGLPGLLVPYATPEEDEQLRRAGRLERLGAVRVLPPAELSPPALAAEIVALRDFAPRPASVELDGARRTANLLAALLGGDLAEPRLEDAVPDRGACRA